ncbi:MAG TPA: hypothetical protein VK763_00890 [Terriglobales bacterium]|jgi:hypothetical protein|nr:hypothetical protein [Terriglobales bacterium]
MTEKSGGLPSEAEVVYEATKDAVVRTRRILLLVSGLIGVGFFYLFVWYGSWELARIDGRRAAVALLIQKNSEGDKVTDTLEGDKALLQDLDKKASELESHWADREFDVPLVNLKVASADFSVAILMIAIAMLFWLLFNQRRLNACLTRLEKLQGWALVAPLLEFHFILIGSHASPKMRAVARLLVLGLPILALSFFASDCLDLYFFWHNRVDRLFFVSCTYDIRVLARLLLGFTLAVIVTYVGLKCFREFRQSEDELLRYAQLSSPSENVKDGVV